MRTIELIKRLQKSLEEGFEYVSTDGLGGFSLTTSKTSFHENEENLVYVTIFNPSVEDDNRDFEDLVEGEDYAHIKCKVLSTNIRKSDMEFIDLYECFFNVNPVGELPEWYVGYYEEDFKGIPILNINRRMQKLNIQLSGFSG